MSETAPAPPVAPAPAPVEKTLAKKAVRKAAGTGGPRHKAAGPPISELITKAVEASKERSGVSVAALKKVLAAAGYDVEKNNSRIKLGLKSLVSKGTLVQTKGTGASGSFKLNKKPPVAEGKGKGKKAVSTKAKKPSASAKKIKKVSGEVASKKSAKTPKKVKPATVGTRKAAKSPKKPKAKKVTKSPAKTKLAKPKAAKPKKAASKK